MTSLSNAAPASAQFPHEGIYVSPFEDLRMADVESVGGKNASLGEMISQLAEAGVRVPGGFAATADAFRDFLRHSADGGPSLGQRIELRLENLNIDDTRALAAGGAEIRQWIVETPFQPPGTGNPQLLRAPGRRFRKTCPTLPSPASRRPS
jgi:pyruvate,water dikinase